MICWIIVNIQWIFEFIKNNGEWIFSGIGIFILTLIWKIISRIRAERTLQQIDKSEYLSSIKKTRISLDFKLVNREVMQLFTGLSIDDLQSLKILYASKLDKITGDQYLSYDLDDKLPEYSCLALIDIDNLTQINHRFGMHIGDDIIIIILHIIKIVSKTDEIGRCGADTFYAIFRNLDLNKMRRIASNIRRCVKNFDWSILATDLYVTCSIGIANKSAQQSPIKWVQQAAKGMRKAKRSGGDRVELGPKYYPQIVGEFGSKKKRKKEKHHSKVKDIYTTSYYRRFYS